MSFSLIHLGLMQCWNLVCMVFHHSHNQIINNLISFLKKKAFYIHGLFFKLDLIGAVPVKRFFLKCQTWIYDGNSLFLPVANLLCLSSPLVTVVPAAPVLQQSILRLTASVNPSFAITKITWEAPGGNTMKIESTNKGTVAKLPKVQASDGGTYVCVVHPLGNSSRLLYHFNVDVTVGECDLRGKKAGSVQDREHLLSLLLMVWVGISARNTSSCIIYWSILELQFFKVTSFIDQFQKSTVDLHSNSSSPCVNIIDTECIIHYFAFCIFPLPSLLLFFPQLTKWSHPTT